MHWVPDRYANSIRIDLPKSRRKMSHCGDNVWGVLMEKKGYG